VLSSDAVESEWEHRGTEAAWSAYTDAICELAETRSVDVLAHPDVIKVTGRRPGRAELAECHERIASATASAGLAAEISSSGWRKPAEEAYPAPSLLAAFAELSVPVTTASDTHGLTNLAERGADLMALARGAGYSSLRAFSSRRGHDVPLESPVGDRSASSVPSS